MIKKYGNRITKKSLSWFFREFRDLELIHRVATGKFDILLNLVQYLLKKYPWAGSNANALGSSRLSSMRTFLADPFSLLTSILSFPVSDQYKFRATQSTATSWGYSSLLDTITSTSNPRKTM